MGRLGGGEVISCSFFFPFEFYVDMYIHVFMGLFVVTHFDEVALYGDCFLTWESS